MLREQLSSLSWIDHYQFDLKTLHIELDDLWHLCPKEHGQVIVFNKIYDVPRFQKSYGKDY